MTYVDNTQNAHKTHSISREAHNREGRERKQQQVAECKKRMFDYLQIEKRVSYKFVKEELYADIYSKNTTKQALNELMDQGLILIEHQVVDGERKTFAKINTETSEPESFPPISDKQLEKLMMRLSDTVLQQFGIDKKSNQSVQEQINQLSEPDRIILYVCQYLIVRTTKIICGVGDKDISERFRNIFKYYEVCESLLDDDQIEHLESVSNMLASSRNPEDLDTMLSFMIFSSRVKSKEQVDMNSAAETLEKFL